MKNVDTYLREDGTMVVPWEDPNHRILHLLTPDEYKALPMGTILGCIDGLTAVKSTNSNDRDHPDYIDQDTRFGRLAWGTIAEDQQD
jgi:hypothetical protein